MNQLQFRYGKLDVVIKSRELIRSIYRISQNLPESEKFGLSSQLKRASVSVLCNVAEGLSRRSTKEKIRFIELSFGSLVEIDCLLVICQDLELLIESETQDLKKLILTLTKLLSGLRRSLIKSSTIHDTQ